MSKQQEAADRGTELVEAFLAEDSTRREFSDQAGIAVSTLDYYLRRENERLRKAQHLLPVLVTVKPEESRVLEIAVVVGNGRRVLSVLERA